jgi:uncharacterized membrane protein YbhN (UPF0104 family)
VRAPGESKSRPFTPRLGTVLRWGFGLCVVAALLLFFDPRTVASNLSETDCRLAVPAILGLSLVHLLGVAAWVFLSAQLSGAALSWRYAARSYYAAQVLGSVTPGNIGADAYRIHSTAQGPCGLEGAVVPVAGQRITSYLALLAIGASASFLVPLPHGFALTMAIVAGALIALLGLGWGVLRLVPEARQRAAHLTRRLGLVDLWAKTPRGRLLKGLSGGFALAVLFHGTSLLLTYVLVLSVSGRSDVFPTLAALAMARLSMLLPFSVNGLGFQEGALTILLPQVGVASEAALAVSALNRLGLLVTIGFGTAALAMGKSVSGGKREAFRLDGCARGRRATRGRAPQRP